MAFSRLLTPRLPSNCPQPASPAAPPGPRARRFPRAPASLLGCPRRAGGSRGPACRTSCVRARRAPFGNLRARQVDLVSLRDGFSLDSPAGRLHARILASVAEYETEVRAERVRAGQTAAKARGKRWGGSEKGRLLKVTPEQVEAIATMVAQGHEITRIARITGLSRPTVYRVLENEK
ncbi:MAG TPA: recombinase family protein [Phycisphaerae bacterium]|nr:recombinase family protein [Phycisphaerae bacterium]HRY70515.1 recombinase family protein [Phycisphaerae bacterium]HSA28244.1 recombinase family protein [Phycisphaerae bacterium]